MAKTEHKKKKLNLTIAPDAKARALLLADKTRRSISSLFEALIDEEWERTGIKEGPIEAYGSRAAKSEVAEKKKIGFRDSLGVAISALAGGEPARVPID